MELPRSLLKHRFRPSSELTGLKEALSRLPAEALHAAVSEKRAKLLASIQELERDEVSRWREGFLSAALGREPTSSIGQILAAHKFAYDKVCDRHRKRRHEFQRAQKEACVALEASLRVEVWRLQDSVKKQARGLTLPPLAMRPSLVGKRAAPHSRACAVASSLSVAADRGRSGGVSHGAAVTGPVRRPTEIAPRRCTKTFR